MIYLVHGDGKAKTRALILNQQKKLNVETKTELELDDTTPQKLLSLCSTNSIFGDVPFLLLDISAAGRRNVDEYIEILKKVPKETTLIVVSYKELSNSNPFIKNANSVGIKVIKSEKIPTSDIFKFLDSLAVKNRKATYNELYRLLEDDGDEIYLISMIQYLLRNLAAGVFRSSLFDKMNPYVKRKTESQIRLYNIKNLKNLYNYVYEIEKKVKTGVIDPGGGLTLSVEKVLNS